MEKMVCKECGGQLIWVDPTRWICPYCSTNYVVEAARSVITVRSPQSGWKMYSYSTSTTSTSTSTTSTTLQSYPYGIFYLDDIVTHHGQKVSRGIVGKFIERLTGEMYA